MTSPLPPSFGGMQLERTQASAAPTAFKDASLAAPHRPEAGPPRGYPVALQRVPVRCAVGQGRAACGFAKDGSSLQVRTQPPNSTAGALILNWKLNIGSARNFQGHFHKEIPETGLSGEGETGFSRQSPPRNEIQPTALALILSKLQPQRCGWQY